MFQYTQALIEALSSLSAPGTELHAVYWDRRWETILKAHPAFHQHVLRGGRLGDKLAMALMALRLPLSLTRVFTRAFNPIDWQLRWLGCDYWILPAQDAIGYQLSVPCVVSIHDLMHRYEARFPEVSGQGRFAIREHRFSNLAKTALHVLVDSEVGRKQVVQAYTVAEHKVSSLPYIPPGYIFETEEPPDFDARFSLPKRYIFYPAQFWPHKNHRRLLDALAEVHQGGVTPHLVLSGGKAHEYENLVRQIEALGLTSFVTFLGYVPDAYLRGLYRRARAMVMPTAFGPTNIPPLEAFASGCPAAVSNIYGMPEQADGAALLFDPESKSEIAAALARLWTDDDLCRQLSDKGRLHASRWGRSQFKARLEQILSKCDTRPLGSAEGAKV